MTLATVYTRANVGIEAPLVTVETHLSNGLPSISIVGLPETAVKESKERVRSAIISAGLEFPTRRLTVNLAPADLPKSSGRFDLAIALSILAASEQIPAHILPAYEVLGELALTGDLRGVQGVLPAVLAARDMRRSLILPAVNADEASLVRGVRGYSAGSLLDVYAHLNHAGRAPPANDVTHGLAPVEFNDSTQHARPVPQPDISEIRGQHLAKRALQIAAAGGHNLLLIGPPGTGKTMLANCLLSLLPTLAEQQALEVAAVRSVSGQRIDPAQWLQPPFRAPHHTATNVALVGGGKPVGPGEVTLAHHGVLFLDELTEFRRTVLESLREPLEAGTITVSRANQRIQFPASFQLVAAMNPCPCGYHGDPFGQCRCSPERVEKYLEKISGPLLDRIDLSIEVPRLDYRELTADNKAEPVSAAVRQRLEECQALQRERSLRLSGVVKLNHALTVAELESVSRLDKPGQKHLQAVMDKLRLSARAYHRILKIARTIADFEGRESIDAAHVSEAVAYRTLERFFRSGK